MSDLLSTNGDREGKKDAKETGEAEYKMQPQKGLTNSSKPKEIRFKMQSFLIVFQG